MTGVIPFASPENDVHVVVFPRIGHVRQVLVRAVEINVVVVIAIEKIADVERTAETDEMTDGVRMPEGNVGGMISTKTRSADANAMGTGLAPREIEDIVHNYIFISDMGADAIAGMNPFVVKTVEVN